MQARVRGKLTYSNVVATLALFLAIAGGTTAIALSGRNSVHSDDIAPRAVHGSDIARGAVTSPKVSDGSLQIEDFAAGEVPAGSGVYSSRFTIPDNDPRFGPVTGVFGNAVHDRDGAETITPDTPLRAHDFAVELSGIPTGGSRGFVLVIGGGLTPLACTITAPESSCATASGTSVQIPAAGTVAIEEVSSGSPVAPTDAMVAFRVDPQ